MWTLELRDVDEWRRYCLGQLPHQDVRPDDIPASPDTVYRSAGWNSWADWLGTAPVVVRGKTYLPFPAARECARTLGLSSEAEWNQYCRMALGGSRPALPADLPLSPDKVYERLGWQGWRDWLIAPAEFRDEQPVRSYAAARRLVRGLKLRNVSEWNQYCRGELPDRGPLPRDIPATPHKAYRGNGWLSWGDWLGTGGEAARRRKTRPFREARRFARGLGLKSIREWDLYCQGKMKHLGRRPDGVPSRPDNAYRNDGWVNWGDWLGTGTVSTRLRKFRPFAEAREFARGLRLQSVAEWKKYRRGEMPGREPRPPDIPTTPQSIYGRDGWMGWGDWLGVGTIVAFRREFRPFAEAREFARGLRLQSLVEWDKYRRGEMPDRESRPPDIPARPRHVYRHNGWVSWGDWLGTGRVATSLREFRPFAEAREFARGLRLQCGADWHTYCRGEMPDREPRPPDIPIKPDGAYAGDGWVGWGDWLGTGRVANYLRRHRPFAEAREFARGLRLQCAADWYTYCRGEMPDREPRPPDIPIKPDGAYAGDGWVSWGDWLGTGRIANYLREYRPFAEAREFARGLRLQCGADWYTYCRGEMPDREPRPPDIPASPEKVFRRDGWVSWGDWLGTGRVAPCRREFRPFAEAREFARGLALSGTRDWERYCRGEKPHLPALPGDMPRDPSRIYRSGGWLNWRDWLGASATAAPHGPYRPFAAARRFAQGLGMKSFHEWQLYGQGRMKHLGRRPDDLPSTPDRVYRNDGWVSWGDWLGTGTVAPSLRERRPFAEAREFARGLRLRSVAEWRRYCHGDMPGREPRPPDIPARPDTGYRSDEWMGWGDWLRTGRVATRARQ
ncbi:MAG: hypothetical protein A3K19_03660 [Lentisphaerae bacterium RIFOXYB12_FULL_65_16]|nr:MAG: hypothetical protein A3K18_30050 [Lentisphaerae bacterium RIFOXYA12_64_32]OGV86608.1 MAG: hypothetical protein A3K19_03660 [Lentisphaerae bacterium RIFOXYB12_FULL_65_16]